MPVNLPDGKHGLLEYNKLGPTVEKELPNYENEVKGVTDSRVLMALFRDYTFLASAYLLEPCDLEFRKSGEYGLGRPVLPRQIAVPLSIVAKKIGARPFMEYAQSYSLYNWQKIDKSGGLDYKNLRLIRSFTGIPSESAFILIHVAM
jgi:indoleamine 2,3-dioxygenase